MMADAFADATVCVVVPSSPEVSCLALDSLLSLWGYDAANVPDSVSDIAATVQALDALVPFYVASALGRIVREPANGTVTGASSILLSYPVDASSPPLADFETALVKYVSSAYQDHEDLRLYAFASTSFDEEIKRLVAGDAPLLLAAIALVVVWLALSSSFGLLAFAAFPTVLVSVAFAFAAQALAGRKASSINFLVSFIVAGVGVDDMILVESFYVKRGKNLPSALEASGHAIFLTSFTAVVAFTAGAFCDVPAVSSFCECGALSFAMNFALNVTAFPALLDHVRGGRQRSNVKTPPEALEAHPPPPSSVECFLGLEVAPVLSSRRGKIATLLAFSALVASSFFAASSMEVGIAMTSVVPDDSYVVDFFGAMDRNFDSRVRAISVQVEVRAATAATAARTRASHEARRVYDVRTVLGTRQGQRRPVHATCQLAAPNLTHPSFATFFARRRALTSRRPATSPSSSYSSRSSRRTPRSRVRSAACPAPGTITTPRTSRPSARTCTAPASGRGGPTSWLATAAAWAEEAGATITASTSFGSETGWRSPVSTSQRSRPARACLSTPSLRG